jgi:hypothetical protein
MFQLRMIGRILVESTMARRQLQKLDMRLYEVLKTRHCADFESFCSIRPQSRPRVQEGLNEEPLPPVNMDYIYWLRVHVTVRELAIQQAKRSLILTLYECPLTE